MTANKTYKPDGYCGSACGERYGAKLNKAGKGQAKKYVLELLQLELLYVSREN